MTRYRLRAVLLLFLVLNLTACYTWQGVATTSPAGVMLANLASEATLQWVHPPDR